MASRPVAWPGTFMKHRAKMDLNLPGKAKPGFDRRPIPCNTSRIETGFRHSKQTQIHFRSVFHEVPGLDQD